MLATSSSKLFLLKKITLSKLSIWREYFFLKLEKKNFEKSIEQFKRITEKFEGNSVKS